MVIAAATSGFLADRSGAEILAEVRQRAATTALRDRLGLIEDLLAESRTSGDIVARLGSGITVLDSCPTALYVALRFRTEPFESMLRFVIDCGGDVDTIAAMAGAMWGAGRGADALPAVAFEGRAELQSLADQVHAFARM